jgi:hypothetical protein
MNTNDVSKQHQPDRRLVNLFSSLFKRRALVFTLVALMGCATVALAVRAYNLKAPESKESTTLAEMPAVAAPVASGAQVKSEVEGEVVTLKKWGFEPKELIRSPGKFLLYVNNQSQLTESLTFSLIEANGVKLKETKLDFNGKHKWDNFLDLRPGNYQLRVLEHPEWVCQVTITAN